LATEHEHLNDEQIAVAIFSSAEGEDPDVFTHRAFDEWQVCNQGEDNGALLAIFASERKAAMMAGSGPADSLGARERERVLNKGVRPEHATGDVARAVSLGTLEILQSLHSPLVSAAKAKGILRAGGFTGSFIPRATATNKSPRSWWPWFVLGAGLLIAAG